MKIGIDLDGVVFDSENYYRTSSELFDIENNGSGIIDAEELKISKRYHWSNAKTEKYFNEYLLDVLENSPLMPYAKKVIDKLKNDGHFLVAITSRGTLSPKEIEITEKRLLADKLKFDKVYYLQSDKLKTCQSEKIDLMIDDFFDIVTSLSDNGIKCLYFRTLVKKEINRDNVIEVRNWGDIYRAVLKISAEQIR